MSETIFISFSTKDGNDITQDVHDFYEDVGYVVFWSKEKIPAGRKWEEVIEEYLRKCDIFILIATREALESTSG